MPLTTSSAQGFVDLELLCTFSRMADALGLRKVKEGKTKQVNPEILAQVHPPSGI